MTNSSDLPSQSSNYVLTVLLGTPGILSPGSTWYVSLIMPSLPSVALAVRCEPTYYILFIQQSEALLSREAIAYWTSFASNDDPSAVRLAISPAWEPFVASETGRQRIQITRGDDGSPTTNSVMQDIGADELERCDFWMSEEVTNETFV
jgi:hypothetical protein